MRIICTLYLVSARRRWYAMLYACLCLCLIDGSAMVWAEYSEIMTPLDGVVWKDTQSSHIGGVAIRTVSFMSPLSAHALTEKFSRSYEAFDRVLMASDQFVLSGLEGGWHWMAMIGSTPTGAAGYISKMKTQGTPSVVPEWLPPHVRVMFSHSEVLESMAVNQYVYQHRWPIDQFHDYVGDRLKRQGWTLLTSSQFAPSQLSWQRRGETLTISIASGNQPRTVFVQHVTQRTMQ